MGTRLKSDNWWLRSPGNNDNNAALVNGDGSVNTGGNNVDNDNNAIRPDLSQQPETSIHEDAVRAGAKEPCSHPLRYWRKDKQMLSEQVNATRFYPLPVGAFRPTAGSETEVKRISDFAILCDFDNLYRAHKKARLGKRHKADVIAFEMDLADNLWRMKERLESESYAVGGYKRFFIHDPKTREIQALCYADRIVQHSLCDNVLTPFFEKRLIYDNCACREGKGTHFGMKRLEGFLREHYRHHSAEGWILGADVRKFFSHVGHAVLLERLRRIIPDPDVMRLLTQIVQSFHAEPGRGLPMGNQTSQLFALYYLDPLDRLIKEKLRIRHYTRYMDDMVLVHPDKDFLKECLRQMRALLETELHMEFNEKTHIFPMQNGVDYLGWHFYLTDTGKVVKRLRAQNKKKLKRRLKGLQKGYAEGRLSWEDVKRSTVSTNGHLLHGHTYRLREKLYKQTVYIRKTKEELQ